MSRPPLTLFLMISASVACFVATASAQQISGEFNGRLVSLRGRSAVPFADAALPQAKYIALYYSAGWCPPCHTFTPQLVKFYNEMKPKYPDFEVVFISQDESANQMEKYMAEMSMPWPALRYSATKGNRALNKYCGPGIPCLVVVNEKGEVLSDSYEGTKYLGPGKVMNDLSKLLAEGPTAVARPLNDAATASNATSPKPADSTLKSPSGTNWDEVFKKKP